MKKIAFLTFFLFSFSFFMYGVGTIPYIKPNCDTIFFESGETILGKIVKYSSISDFLTVKICGKDEMVKIRWKEVKYIGYHKETTKLYVIQGRGEDKKVLIFDKLPGTENLKNTKEAKRKKAWGIIGCILSSLLILVSVFFILFILAWGGWEPTATVFTFILLLSLFLFIFSIKSVKKANKVLKKIGKNLVK